MHSTPKELLVLQFGQLGDVLLCLPALAALREHFPDARITGVTGLPPREILEMCGFFDELITVDRVALRDGRKLRAIREILSLIARVRSRHYDLVIDFHSLWETNLLGFVSPAPKRLYCRRRSRSIDFLSNFRPAPPAFDEEQHMSEAYMALLEPLGIAKPEKIGFELGKFADRRLAERFREALGEFDPGLPLVGINIGAGNPARIWPIERYRELSAVLSDNAKVVLFWGPEEKELFDHFKSSFASGVAHFPGMGLRELVAAFTSLDLVIGNDTGPMHLASMSGTPTLVIKGGRTDPRFEPPGALSVTVTAEDIRSISVETIAKKAFETLSLHRSG